MLTAGINMLNKIYEGNQCVCERVFVCVCVSRSDCFVFSLSLSHPLSPFPCLFVDGFPGLVA